MTNSGYLHPLYAQSLTEFGEPIELPASEGWILKRPIHETSQFDGIGCYPIFACKDWSNLGKDLDWVSNQLISLSLVTDPFGNYTQPDLIVYFKDVARPYKEHFIVDLQQRPEEFVDSHHQRNAHKALKTVKVEICTEPIRFLDDWTSLYANLINRHHIHGIAKFSRVSFAKQLSVPGVVVVRAVLNDQILGMLLWYVQSDLAYYHLGAYSQEGYRQKASFALFWVVIEHFKQQGFHWLSLGAGAGVQGDPSDGLTRFKQGWSTGTRIAYFGGRIFDPQKYQELVSARGIGNTSYFPAYRADELA
jgi:hypothetical protein